MFPLGFPGGSDGNKSTCNAGDPGLIPGLGPTPVFLSGEFHGQRSLESYSPWGCKESDWATNTFTFSLTKLKQAFFLKLRPLGSFYFGRLVNFFSLPFWNVNLFNSLLVLQPRKSFSRTWEPSFWNVISKGDCLAPIFQLLKEGRDQLHMSLLQVPQLSLAINMKILFFLWMKPISKHRWLVTSP